MKLPKEDVELFYKLYHSLLAYVNRKFDIVKGINSPGDFRECPIEEIDKVRDKLYNHPELIDSFVAENPLNFSSEELEIISSWKNFVRGRFLIFRYLKKYTIFLDPDDPPKAYGVLALISTFEELVGPHLPVMVEATLLPFKNKIVYDSILIPYCVTFGSGIRRSFNDAYQEAKSRFGIITSLPFSPEQEKVEQSDADKLRFYLRSRRNREMYREEIGALIDRNPDLLTLYHQEMGKVHARTYGKRLREIGLRKGWFAILKGIIIASGTTKDEVEKILQRLVPPEEQKFVYIFQLRQK
ncbi:MAG: hypothetical protein JRI31_09790 [Deltaproteobacteria bacterium]|nr:hypothetical protein [Deltaproteobacteria bacterium]